MKVVLQRVSEASVKVRENTVGSISKGLVLLLGISKTDSTGDADYLLEKVLGLRIFPDDEGKMNRNIQESGGALLVISQFTLYADCRKGRRPSFDAAAAPIQAEALYDYFVQAAKKRPIQVETGVFQAMMQVQLVNEGPVTIIIDSADRARS
jgi:D-aminoacyl-tRNA deacylase